MADFPKREAIEVRAYELYVARGREEGHEVEDWLEAERQLFEAQNAAPRAAEPSARSQKSAARLAAAPPRA
ncbi:MAG TPA: DUF2934 domain-containing protein [Candidatus Acidoferrales bacterium]|nr:DUF2934 domain-containing protein [Candidatus Acidoferrales bacterium]